MTKTRMSPKARRNAVARILEAASSSTVESQRLGVDRRTVDRWVAAARAAGGKLPEEPVVASDAPPQNAQPPGEGPETSQNEALNAALDAAGEKPEAGAGGAPPPEAVADARLDAQKFCLDAIGEMKMAVGSILVQFRYDPPLKLSDRRVQEKLQLGPLATAAIRSNAEKLYPVLTGMMSGRFQLIAALGLEALLLLVGLEKLAKEEGWKAPAKDAPKAPEGMKGARGGSPMDLAADIERARREQVPQPMPGMVPDTSTPTTGTINAPAAE